MKKIPGTQLRAILPALLLTLACSNGVWAQNSMAGHDMSGDMAGHDMPAGMAGHDMPGHDMSGHDMSAMDPHAHHHMADMDMTAQVKRSVQDVRLKPIPMLRQDGSSTTLSDELAGNQPSILAFIYTTCTTICPVTSQILSGVQDVLGAELPSVRMLSVSIDPEYDTPERLREYAARFDAQAQWQHYGGTLANSVAVQKLFNAYRGDKMNHVSLIYINGGGKKGWVKLEGFPTAEQIVHELHAQMRG